MSSIVVGIDGSPNSHVALAWAMREAALRHTPLTVLTVHPTVSSHATGNPVSFPGDAARVDEARRAAEEAVSKAAAELGQAPAVTVRAVNGYPAAELIGESRDADMVVVGSRGNGGFSRLLLGSVSTQVAHHATCPIVVVPSHREAAA